jgi:hypothetical protein
VLFVVAIVLRSERGSEMAKRVRPKPSSGTGHVDAGGYSAGSWGPAFGEQAGAFDVAAEQFAVRPSASQPTPGPTPKPGLFYWDPKGGSK